MIIWFSFLFYPLKLCKTTITLRSSKVGSVVVIKSICPFFKCTVGKTGLKISNFIYFVLYAWCANDFAYMILYNFKKVNGSIALLSRNTLKWSAILGLSFFVCCWLPRESMLRGSSMLREFHTSLSKVLTLWHCVKVKQHYHTHNFSALFFHF